MFGFEQVEVEMYKHKPSESDRKLIWRSVNVIWPGDKYLRDNYLLLITAEKGM